MMNETLKVLKERYSCPAFTDELPEREKLEAIAQAAQSVGVASRIIAINEVAFMGERAAELKEKLRFPENYEFGLAVLLGNAAKTKEPHVPDPGKIVYVN